MGSGDSQGNPRPLSHPFSSCEKIVGLGTLHFVFYTSIKFETQKGCVSGEQTQHVRENGWGGGGAAFENPARQHLATKALKEEDFPSCLFSSLSSLTFVPRHQEHSRRLSPAALRRLQCSFLPGSKRGLWTCKNQIFFFFFNCKAAEFLCNVYQAGERLRRRTLENDPNSS